MLIFVIVRVFWSACVKLCTGHHTLYGHSMSQYHLLCVLVKLLQDFGAKVKVCNKIYHLKTVVILLIRYKFICPWITYINELHTHIITRQWLFHLSEMGYHGV